MTLHLVPVSLPPLGGNVSLPKQRVRLYAAGQTMYRLVTPDRGWGGRYGQDRRPAKWAWLRIVSSRVEPDNLLSPQITAHCFFAGRCKHTVTDTPNAAHDAMEAHYRADHQTLIDLALRGMIGQSPKR